MLKTPRLPLNWCPQHACPTQKPVYLQSRPRWSITLLSTVNEFMVSVPKSLLNNTDLISLHIDGTVVLLLSIIYDLGVILDPSHLFDMSHEWSLAIMKTSFLHLWNITAIRRLLTCCPVRHVNWSNCEQDWMHVKGVTWCSGWAKLKGRGVKSFYIEIKEHYFPPHHVTVSINSAVCLSYSAVGQLQC